jgi:hypothetical protein
VVEQPAVNRLVAGSNPARGAKFFKDLVGDMTLQFCSVSPRGYIWGKHRCFLSPSTSTNLYVRIAHHLAAMPANMDQYTAEKRPGASEVGYGVTTRNLAVS